MANKCSLFSHYLLSSAGLSIFISSTNYTERFVSPYAIFLGLALFVSNLLSYYKKMIIKWDHNYITCFEKTYHLHCSITVNTRNIPESYSVITGIITHWMNSSVSNSSRPLNSIIFIPGYCYS